MIKDNFVFFIFDPWMIDSVFDAHSFFWVLLQQFIDEVLGLGAEVFPEDRIIGDGVLNGLSCDFFLVVLVVEGQAAAEQQIGDDADGPEVAFLVVGSFEQHFGRDVRDGAEGLGAGLGGADDLAQPEVQELHVGAVRVLRHDDVFGLQVAVHDAVGVEVVDCAQELRDYSLRVRFFQLVVPLLDVREQVRAFAELHYQVDVVLVLVDVVELDDVRVVADLQHVHLGFDELVVRHVHVRFVEDFDGDDSVRFFVDAFVDDREFPDADLLFDLVVFFDVFVAQNDVQVFHPVFEVRFVVAVIRD